MTAAALPRRPSTSRATTEGHQAAGGRSAARRDGDPIRFSPRSTPRIAVTGWARRWTASGVGSRRRRRTIGSLDRGLSTASESIRDGPSRATGRSRRRRMRRGCARASSIGLPRTIASSSAGSRTATCVGGGGDREADRLAGDDGVADVDVDRVLDELVAGPTLARSRDSAIELTGRIVDGGDRAGRRSGPARRSRPPSRRGSPGRRSGSASPRTAVSGKTVAPAGAEGRIGQRSLEVAWQATSSAARALSTSSWVTQRELLAASRRSSPPGW